MLSPWTLGREFEKMVRSCLHVLDNPKMNVERARADQDWHLIASVTGFT